MNEMGVREAAAPPARAVIIAVSALAFVLTMTEVVAICCQEAPFLHHNPTSRIPLAAALGSVLAAALSLAGTPLVRRTSARAVARGVFIAMAALLAALATCAGRLGPASSFAQYVVLDAALIVLSASAWAFILEPLNEAAAKRVLPRAGVFAALGGLAGGALVPVWLLHGSSAGLLVLAAALSFGASILVATMAHGGAAKRPESASPPTLRGLHAPLARQAATQSALFVIIRLIVEMLFKSALQARYDEHGIATFFAVTEGASAILSLPVAIWMSGPIVSRLGSARSLALLPGFLCVGLMAYGALGAFPIVVSAMLVLHVLKPSLQTPAEGCLIGALPERDRGPFTMIVDGAVNPAACAVGGIIFAAMSGAALLLTAPWMGAALAAVYVARSRQIRLAPYSSAAAEIPEPPPSLPILSPGLGPRAPWPSPASSPGPDRKAWLR